MQSLRTLARDGDGFRVREGVTKRREAVARNVPRASSALLSMSALRLPIPRDSWLQGLPGMLYALLPIAMGVFGVVTGRQLKSMRATAHAGAAQ